MLALLALAGLLRPEAWLFSVAYLALPGARPRPRPRAAAAAARRAELRRPASWSGWSRWPRRRRSAGRLFDLITTGDAAYSFTGTRDTVETLERQTGPVDLVLYGPRRLGEVLQWPGLVGAAGGARALPRADAPASD